MRGEVLERGALPIGVLDSGVGGISVLKKLKQLLPCENYLYLSDTKNAPYGIKSVREIVDLTEEAVKKLLLYPCKIIVIACNTATAASVEYLRDKYPKIHIVGLEPAITPAVREFGEGKILVLTTAATEKTERFKRLVGALNCKKRIICLPTQKVVSFVEEGMGDSPALVSYLKSAFFPYRKEQFSAVVLGCTHFPFAKNAIEKALGYSPRFYDGAEGAAKRVRTLLLRDGILNKSELCGETVWLEDGFSAFGRKIMNKAD